MSRRLLAILTIVIGLLMQPMTNAVIQAVYRRETYSLPSPGKELLSYDFWLVTPYIVVALVLLWRKKTHSLKANLLWFFCPLILVTAPLGFFLTLMQEARDYWIKNPSADIQAMSINVMVNWGLWLVASMVALALGFALSAITERFICVNQKTKTPAT